MLGGSSATLAYGTLLSRPFGRLLMRSERITTMATNYIQPGRSITVAAPTGGVLSGDGVLIGTLFGIAQYDAVEGAEVEILTEGVVKIGKTSALAIGVGDRLFWDDTNKLVNKTTTAQQQVGVAVAAAANPSATVKMLIRAALPVAT
jgi:predicted RecA/RadA family phage recombinase